jgi:hypothetical protein
VPENAMQERPAIALYPLYRSSLHLHQPTLLITSLLFGGGDMVEKQGVLFVIHLLRAEGGRAFFV